MKNILLEINNSGLKLLEPLDLHKTYETIAKEVITLIKADHSSIFLKRNGDLDRVYTTFDSLYKIKARKKGLSFKALTNLQPFLAEEKDLNPKIKKLGIKFAVFVPLRYKNETIGALSAEYFNKKVVTKEELNALKLFGSMASLAIKKNQAIEEAKKIAEDRKQILLTEKTLEKIYQSGLKFLVPLAPEETYEIIVKEAVKLVSAKFGSIILEQNGELQRVYASSPIAFKIKNRKKGFRYKAFKEKTTIIADISEVEKRHPQLKELGIKTSIFIPLSYRNKSIGVLTINSTKKKENIEKELHILKLFGSMASLAIRKTQLYNEAQKALEARNLFISMAAHEFRTPLTSINGYAQLLNTRLGLTNTTEARWVRELNSECTRMTNLVNELLEISRIQSGKLNYALRECNIYSILHKAIYNFRFNHPGRKIVFENDIVKNHEKVVGDPDKLLQVFTNILDNAAKYSSSDTEIIIKLTHRVKYIDIKVIDQGKGIEKQDLPMLFKGFYKGKDSLEEGMGLGLYLTKNIIEQHHGDINIKSKVKKGTTVEVKLPSAKL